MGARRFGPLILLLCLGSAVICARLFEVQVLQHETWRDEARNLVRQDGSDADPQLEWDLG